MNRFIYCTIMFWSETATDGSSNLPITEEFLVNIFLHWNLQCNENKDSTLEISKGSTSEIYLFVGDILIEASSLGLASRHKSLVISALQDHSFILNRKKINLTPAQILLLLGVVVCGTSPLGGSPCQNNGT